MSKAPKKRGSIGQMARSFKKYYVPFFICVALLLVSVFATIRIPNSVQELTALIDPTTTATENGVLVYEKVVSPDGTKLAVPETPSQQAPSQEDIKVAKVEWTPIQPEAEKTEAEGVVRLESDKIFSVCVRLIALLMISFVGNLIAGFILNTIIQKYSRDLREEISHKINRLPLNFYDTKQTGDILSVITNDVDTLATSLQNSISLIIQSGVMLVGVLIAMYVSNWQMATTVLASLPLMLIIVGLTFRFAIPEFDKTQNILGVVNAVVEENYSGQLVIKAFNAEKRKEAEFEEENGKLKKSLFRSQAIGPLVEPAMNLISYLTYAAVLIVAGLLLKSGQIGSVAIVTGFLVYISLFQEPLMQLGQAGSTIQLGTAACNRVFEFLNSEEITDESSKPKALQEGYKPTGAVEFRDVSFGYDPDKMTIKHFSETIKPGMKVAIIGPTGAGKTTLVNLLMRFYEINEGDILIDGISIRDMTRTELRELFGMILQETWVINGSLRENIVYNLQGVEEDRLNEILKETNLAHFVSTLPDGIDTVIQKESALSAGQKQLVTIARAMAENAPMFILDEATSNVDTRTEILIQDAMDALTKGRTSFVIAHRLSTIKNSDLIIVMKDGNVVETGTHDTLMELGGLYKEIYNSQFAS